MLKECLFVFLIMEGNVICWELELPTLLGARLQFVLCDMRASSIFILCIWYVLNLSFFLGLLHIRLFWYYN